ISAVRARCDRSLNVNVFCHQPPKAAPEREKAWVEELRPRFSEFGAEPPARLGEIYKTFLHDDAMLAALIAARPRVVSFHFGIPEPDRIQALRDANIMLIASVTNLAEAKLVEAAGMDAVIAQGYEAGGHRGA